jgi:hypothetical protein
VSLPSTRGCQASCAGRPCRFSRLRRSAPTDSLQVCCTLLPIMGFATLQARELRIRVNSRCRSSTRRRRVRAVPVTPHPSKRSPRQKLCAASPRPIPSRRYLRRPFTASHGAMLCGSCPSAGATSRSCSAAESVAATRRCHLIAARCSHGRFPSRLRLLAAPRGPRSRVRGAPRFGWGQSVFTRPGRFQELTGARSGNAASQDPARIDLSGCG